MAQPLVAEPIYDDPPRTSTKADEAYREIRRRIANGSMLPGTPIDQEQLALALNVSTTPLREALRRLESEGFIEISAHREARVRKLSVQDLHDLYEARIILEPFAATLAAQRASDSEISAFALAVDSQPDKVADLAAYHAAIHRRLYASSRNAVLIRLLDRLNDRAGRYRALFLPLESDHARAVHRFYAGLAEAFQRRDGERLSALLREYLEEAMYGFSSRDGRSARPEGFPRIVRDQ